MEVGHTEQQQAGVKSGLIRSRVPYGVEQACPRLGLHDRAVGVEVTKVLQRRIGAPAPTHDRAHDRTGSATQQEIDRRLQVARKPWQPLGITAVQVGEDVERWGVGRPRRLGLGARAARRRNPALILRPSLLPLPGRWLPVLLDPQACILLRHKRGGCPGRC